MANSNMTPSDVRSTVSSIDESKKTTPAKAIQKGTRLGDKAAAGDHVESGFREPKKGGQKY